MLNIHPYTNDEDYPKPEDATLFPAWLLKKADVEKVLAENIGVPLPKLAEDRNRTLLCKSGAKALYWGNGWWSFFGYAADQNDVISILKTLGVRK